MVHNLIIRGFDDDIHSQLGEISRQKGVSINSIVKDAVDIWLKQQKEIPKRHHLLIYDDEESMRSLLKSIDELANKGEWFRCFIPSSDYSITNLLENLNWFNGIKILYDHSHKDTMKYFNSIIHNILQNSHNKELCCLDFLINDISNNYSIKKAIEIEKAYDENRLQGIVFCVYKTNNLLNASITDMIKMFDLHEQIFLIKDEQIYKLHITKENVHKLFLS